VGLFTSRHAYFKVARDRHEDHAKSLLADTHAVVSTDRWWAYRSLPLARRQLCWSHLKRDFASHSEGLAAEKEFGEHGLELCREVFSAWQAFQDSNDRRQLKRTITQLQRHYKPIITTYATKRARNKRCRGMARNLLKAWPALWSFAKHDGVAPTNNHAERALRGAVIYRKLSLGTQSAAASSASSDSSQPHHLPPATPLALRLPQRTPPRTRPRRPSPTTRLTTQRLNAYGFSCFWSDFRNLRVVPIVAPS